MSTRTKEDFDASLKDALEHRLRANEFFKNGDLQSALREYHAVLFKFKGLETAVGNHYPLLPTMAPSLPAAEGADETPQKQLRNALCLTHLNMAAVLIKQEKWKRALECAKSALKLDDNNTKAKFREAQARIGMGEVSQGKQLLLKLQKEKPDVAITNALNQLRVDDKARESKKNSEFKGMYTKPAGKGEDLKPTELKPSGITELVDEEPKGTPIPS